MKPVVRSGAAARAGALLILRGPPLTAFGQVADQKGEHRRHVTTAPPR